jgi:hypothetical protein
MRITRAELRMKRPGEGRTEKALRVRGWSFIASLPLRDSQPCSFESFLQRHSSAEVWLNKASPKYVQSRSFEQPNARELHSGLPIAAFPIASKTHYGANRVDPGDLGF